MESVSIVSVKDYQGLPIELGSTVVYPVRRRSRMWLTELKVETIGNDEGNPFLSGYNLDGRKVNVYNLNNVIRIK